MSRSFSVSASSIGTKIWMALTGFVLVGFVVGHMVGNLKVYFGKEAFNHYAEGLRDFGAPFFAHGQLLWIIRAALLAVVLTHIYSAWKTWRLSKAARGSEGYRKEEALTFTYASRTMRWGGAILLLFVLYHLAHLTLGWIYPGMGHGSPFDNLVFGFRIWWVSLFYIAAMIPLGLHLYHGVWSACQTLNIDNPAIRACRRPLALALALVVVLGNISIPLAVLAGIVK